MIDHRLGTIVVVIVVCLVGWLLFFVVVFCVFFFWGFWGGVCFSFKQFNAHLIINKNEENVS